MRTRCWRCGRAASATNGPRWPSTSRCAACSHCRAVWAPQGGQPQGWVCGLGHLPSTACAVRPAVQQRCASSPMRPPRPPPDPPTSRPHAAPQGKTGQQCAQRWRHRVNPNISKEKWTEVRGSSATAAVCSGRTTWQNLDASRSLLVSAPLLLGRAAPAPLLNLLQDEDRRLATLGAKARQRLCIRLSLRRLQFHPSS